MRVWRRPGVVSGLPAARPAVRWPPAGHSRAHHGVPPDGPKGAPRCGASELRAGLRPAMAATSHSSACSRARKSSSPRCMPRLSPCRPRWRRGVSPCRRADASRFPRDPSPPRDAIPLRPGDAAPPSARKAEAAEASCPSRRGATPRYAQGGPAMAPARAAPRACSGGAADRGGWLSGDGPARAGYRARCAAFAGGTGRGGIARPAPRFRTRAAPVRRPRQGGPTGRWRDCSPRRARPGTGPQHPARRGALRPTGGRSGGA